MTSVGRSDFTQHVEVETPELVVLSYTIAGIGSRVYAGAIDLLLCIAIFIGMIIAVGVLMARLGGSLASTLFASTWVAAIVLLISQFLVFWGYYLLCEGLADGRTFGKWRLGLRVVRDGGYSIGWSASAVRNIMRLLDMQPIVTYLVGIGAITTSKSGKRLGDVVAGTIVVQERIVQSPLRKLNQR